MALMKIGLAVIFCLAVLMLAALFYHVRDSGLKISKPGTDLKIIVNDPMLEKLDRIIELLRLIARNLANK